MEPLQTHEEVTEDVTTSQPFLIQPLSLTREILLLTTVTCTQVIAMSLLAQGIFPDVVITKSFASAGSDLRESPWGPAGYALTAGTFMLPAGRIGDVYGHRQSFIAAWVWLAVASLLGGTTVFSRSFVFFCVCRGLQGMATAMLVPCSLAILGSIYREGHRKHLVFSLFAAGAPIGYTIGAVFSSLIAELSWWPWMYWVTAIACCGLAVLSYFAIPQLPGERHRSAFPGEQRQPGDDKNWRSKFDWAGTATGVSGLILFNVAWNQAPTVGWGAAANIATLTVGVALLVVFIFIERRAPLPLIPIDRLGADSIYVLTTMALAWASFGVSIYYMINFVIRLRGDSLLSAAAQFAPVPITGSAASYLNSYLLGRRVMPSEILAFSYIWFIVGAIICSTMAVKQSYWLSVFWVVVLQPFGMDLSFPSATLLMSQLVPPERQGIAASLIATVVYYSQSIGLGVAGTVQSQVADGSLLKGYRAAFYTSIGLGGGALLVALLPVMELRLAKKLTR